MSAFICSNQHIAYCVAGLHLSMPYRYSNSSNLQWELSVQKDKDFATLVRENYKSVNYRYPKDKQKAIIYKQDWEIILEELQKYREIEGQRKLCLYLMKLLQAYNYQACETPTYNCSKAYRLTRLALAKLAETLLAEMPEYDDLPWGL